jgi:hypothetical protein
VYALKLTHTRWLVLPHVVGEFQTLAAEKNSFFTLVKGKSDAETNEMIGSRMTICVLFGL